MWSVWLGLSWYNRKADDIEKSISSAFWFITLFTGSKPLLQNSTKVKKSKRDYRNEAKARRICIMQPSNISMRLKSTRRRWI